MRRIHRFFTYGLSLCAFVLTLASCDSGDIVEKQYQEQSTGRVAKLTGTFSGINLWSSEYMVVLAGFSDGSIYSVVQKQIPTAVADGVKQEVVLSNISNTATTLELCVVNKLRERIITIASVDISDITGQDTIRFDVGEQEVGMWSSIQTAILDQACIRCHGGNGSSAAGLNLTKGNSHGQLVDVPSSRVDGVMRVASGNAEGSLLHQILADGGENILHVNHTEILSSEFKDELPNVRTLLDRWINNGAEE